MASCIGGTIGMIILTFMGPGLANLGLKFGPSEMTAILLIAMNIWIYMVDQSAGFLMSIFVIIYAIIAFILYVNTAP